MLLHYITADVATRHWNISYLIAEGKDVVNCVLQHI